MIIIFFGKFKVGGFTNSSFLSLVQKESNANSFSRFRPISLCKSSYKITIKILANRIKVLLLGIISENQGGFVPKRQILDNILIVQESLHSSLMKKEKGMIVKLDVANAFDRVNLGFIAIVLQRFGFSKRAIDIIKACIVGPWIAPLVNGRQSEYFQSSRGLRKGCTLSPFLYIIMVDSLSRSLEK